MRLRKKPWIETAIKEYADLVFPKGTFQPEELAGHWQERFPQKQELHVELGTGKGDFITQNALLHPEINFLGIELQQDVIFYAVKKAAELNLKNVQFIVFDINKLETLLLPREAKRFYLNFSDPWPKKRHAKRRLTHVDFLKKYQHLLGKGGEIFLKTDNRPLFDFSLTQFALVDCDVRAITNDLHNSEYNAENIQTEYERKFSGLGEKINRCEVIFRS